MHIARILKESGNRQVSTEIRGVIAAQVVIPELAIILAGILMAV